MVTETDGQIKQAISLIDDLFDPLKSKNYRLAVKLGKSGLSTAVWDETYNKIIAFEKYDFLNAYNHNALANYSKRAFELSAILKNPYKKISLALVHSKSTLVPSALFETDEKNSLLQFNHTLSDDEIVATDFLPNLDAKNIYALPNTVKDFYTKLYSNVSITHYSSSLLEHVLLKNKNNTAVKVIVNVRADGFEVIVIDKGKLAFYNTFQYQTPEDFMYYLLFVFEQLKLNPESVTTELIGHLTATDAIYKLLNKYIRNIAFGERPDAIEYGYKINALPKHHYYSLFSQFLYS